MDNWNIKADVKNTLDNTKDKISDVYHDVKEKVESTTEQIKEKASDFYEESKEQIHSIEGSMEEYSEQFVNKVRKYPLTSLLIAGGIGFVLSKILKK